MTRTVTDAAIMLGAMQSPFGPVSPNAVPGDYTTGLKRGALIGARIGIDVRYFTPEYGGEADIASVVHRAIDVMRSLGATVVETDTGDAYSWIGALLPILLYEFKIEIGKYLRGLRHTPATTLADLIALQRTRCPQEMRYFGQELFEWAQDPPPFLGDLSENGYLAARNFVWAATRMNGIDRVRQEQQLDAIIAPSYSFASAVAAAAGYPSISIPIDVRPDGKPAGMWMYSGFLQEAKLLALAYDLEQALGPRRTPKFLGAVPPDPPDAGICALLPKNSPGQGAGIGMRRDLATGKPMPKR
jgi:amidase